MSDKIEELEAAIAVEDKAIAAAEVVAKQKDSRFPEILQEISNAAHRRARLADASAHQRSRL